MNKFRLRRQKGQGTVEFAFVLVAFLVFAFCLADLTKICYTWLTLQYAINRGVRMAKLAPDDLPFNQKSTLIENEIKLRMTSLGVPYTPANDDSISIVEFVPAHGIEVEIHKLIKLSPLPSLFQSFSGNHSGTYDVHVWEGLDNASL